MHVEFKDNTGERVLTRWQGDFQEKCPHKTYSTARQQKDTDYANKIIEYLNSENPFDVTLSLCIVMILVLLPTTQGLLTCRTVRTKILDNMTDHKVPDLMIKKSYHAVTKYIRLHQIQWAYIYFCCSSISLLLVHNLVMEWWNLLGLMRSLLKN